MKQLGKEKDENIKDEKISFTIFDVIIIFIIGLIVLKFWQILELLIYNEIKPNDVDTIISIILTYSLYGNLKHYLNKNSKKKQ